MKDFELRNANFEMINLQSYILNLISHIPHLLSHIGEDGETMMNAAKKVLDRDTLKEKVYSLRQAGKQVVFTNGCFDLLHIGHVRYLQEARQLGDCLVVAVNSDSSVKQIKEPGRPIIPEGQRAEVVAALGCVDWVTIFDEPDPLDLIRLLKPDVLVKGTDWSEEEIIGAPEVREAGGQVLRIPLVPGSSTSVIVERIASVFGIKDK